MWSGGMPSVSGIAPTRLADTGRIERGHGWEWREWEDPLVVCASVDCGPAR